MMLMVIISQLILKKCANSMRVFKSNNRRRTSPGFLALVFVRMQHKRGL